MQGVKCKPNGNYVPGLASTAAGKYKKWAGQGFENDQILNCRTCQRINGSTFILGQMK